VLRIESTHFDMMKGRRRSTDSNVSEAESAESAVGSGRIYSFFCPNYLC